MNHLSTTDFGLIGYPLSHSFSKMFFTQLFESDGSGRSYDNFEIPHLTPEALYSIVLMNPRLKGFNVTAPYKVAIMEYLDSISPVAKAVGAVNTVKIIRADDGRVRALEGYNTDVIGFKNSLLDFLDGFKPTGALILGTGGASKAVAEALRQLYVPFTFVSHSQKGEGIISYEDITPDFIKNNQLIINATPLGTFPNTDACPPFPYELLSKANYCHDLVYNPEETKFMKLAAAQGAKTKNGLEMLFGQAVESLKIWIS